ncbi:hypothetical protein LP420_08570 [Massilia sp. B-10]|nr:hypothetical protein LP420_08570 [Massilia sp. B-10]UUZ55564.1 hypothetical protein LP419_08085 [Massilia sp. H-1]
METEYMKFSTALVALLMTQSAFAADNCPTGEKHCSLASSAPAILAYGVLCSEVQPENTKYYRAAVDAVFYGHRKEYREAKTDANFQRRIRESRIAAATIPEGAVG